MTLLVGAYLALLSDALLDAGARFHLKLVFLLGKRARARAEKLIRAGLL